MALDKLGLQQDRLCEWLSSDPDFILTECGDLLTMNQYKLIQNQSRAKDQMELLLKAIIQKGEDTQQSFVDVLRKHQARYKELQKFLNPTQGSTTAIVSVEDGSVFCARDITDIRGKSLNMKTELKGGPGNSQSGSCSGHVPQANYTVTRGSYVCLDKISNTTVDGDINLSVTLSSAQVHTDRTETMPSSQDPAVSMIRKNKKELIECLSADSSFILQYVHSGYIVTDRQYHGLMEILQSEKTIIHLIDLLIQNGEESCSCFLQILQKPEILTTYPKLNNLQLRNN